MENSHLKTIDELNESFLLDNKEKSDFPVSVTYDGEALVKSFCTNKAATDIKNAHEQHDIYCEIAPKEKGAASLIKRVFCKINTVKQLYNLNLEKCAKNFKK
ncbi:MAG: hypothetical protein K5756_09380 [Clostridiales bacterium]|nr:hypothetical protein [Clostridiales bacterium]